MRNKRTRRTQVVRQLACEEEQINLGTRENSNWVPKKTLYTVLELMFGQRPYNYYSKEEIIAGKKELRKRLVEGKIKREISLYAIH